MKIYLIEYILPHILSKTGGYFHETYIITIKSHFRKAGRQLGTSYGANIILGVISFIVIFFITFFTNTTTVTGTITSEFLTYAVSLFISLFGAGITKMTLNISRKQAYSMKDMLYVFHHNADRFLIVGLVIAGIGFVTGLPVMFMSMNSDIPVSFILFFSVFDLIISVIIDLFLGLSTYLY